MSEHAVNEEADPLMVLDLRHASDEMRKFCAQFGIGEFWSAPAVYRAIGPREVILRALTHQC